MKKNRTALFPYFCFRLHRKMIAIFLFFVIIIFSIIQYISKTDKRKGALMAHSKMFQCVIVVSLIVICSIGKVNAQIWFNDSDTKTSDVQSSRPVNEASKAS